MSFDLYFYKRKENPVTEKDLANYLNNNLEFNISDSDRQWNYENPETGVYFFIDWNEPDIADEANEEFEGLTNLNFNFSLNFFRPDFFGMESFPIIEKLAIDLNIIIYNPQVDDGTDMYSIAPGAFYANWHKYNRKFIKQMFNELNLRYMPAEKANYIWHYQSNRIKIEAELKEDIFVPNIIVLQSDVDLQLYSMCVWPEHIPVILPKVDYVIIKKSYRSFFKTVTESGMVAFDTIIKELGDAFIDFDSRVPDIKVLRQHAADSRAKRFNQLEIISAVAAFGNRISLDNFVNDRP